VQIPAVDEECYPVGTTRHAKSRFDSNQLELVANCG
jgi:hypothetical protein